METDISNYKGVSPWQMNANNREETYYDKNGNNLGYLAKKEVLKERNYSPYYDGYYPGSYSLEFSKGKKFENISDTPPFRSQYTKDPSYFYKDPSKDAGDEVVYKPLFSKTQTTPKGGRKRKQSRNRKNSKKRKHRRKSIRRRR